MTDLEIIYSLKHCISTDRESCYGCCYKGKYEDCSGKLMKDVLDLINRQQTEIDKYQNEYVSREAVKTVIKNFCKGLICDKREFDAVDDCKLLNQAIDFIPKWAKTNA